MRRFSKRPPKKYQWYYNSILCSFNATTVAENLLVDGSGYSIGASSQSHVANIIRVVGSVVVTASDVQILDNIADAFVAGPACWGIFVQNITDTSVLDPEDSSASGSETCLGVGITETIGIGIDTSIMAGGNGLGVAFAHQYPYSTRIDFDIHSNRRLTNDEVLQFNITRASNSQMALNPDEDYRAQILLRTLVKLP